MFFIVVSKEVSSQMNDGELVEVNHVREMIRGSGVTCTQREEFGLATGVLGDSDQPRVLGLFLLWRWFDEEEAVLGEETG